MIGTITRLVDYLDGSLATGDFQAERSDVDFVVLTDDLVPGDVVAAVGSTCLSGSFVVMIRRIPVLNEGKFYLDVLWSDWIIQRHQLRHHEFRIAGPSFGDLIDEVSGADLRWAVLDVLEKWWQPMLSGPRRLKDPGYQPYVCCRCAELCTPLRWVNQYRRQPRRTGARSPVSARPPRKTESGASRQLICAG